VTDPLAATMADLAPLVGRFRGTGRVQFPTIATYDYRETLELVRDRSRPLIHYVQRAEQRHLGESDWVPSHWESGFLRPIAERTVEMTSAQDGGRLEQMRLDVSVADGVLVLDGASIALVNDPRLVRTQRRIELHGDRLSYRVSMATTRVAELTHHLAAELERVAPDATAGERVDVFFYGSYMSRDVLREVDLVPERVEVARLPGFRLTIGPLANLEPAPAETAFGILTSATHAELERLYDHARNVLGGVYQPERWSWRRSIDEVAAAGSRPCATSPRRSPGGLPRATTSSASPRPRGATACPRSTCDTSSRSPTGRDTLRGP
jgi:THAP4-like, heme-binding beta-barrel domain